MLNAKDIFLRAIACQSLEERAKLIAAACESDDILRRRVEALVAAYDDPNSYLERPAAKFDVTATAAGNPSDLSDSSPHHGRFLPGTKVAQRYRIVSMLGQGGMGEVFRADDLRLGQTVALKFLPPGLADDPKRLEYFHNEVKLARQIAHPNVCRVYDLGEVDGQPFISMEYIDGEDLKVLLQRIGRVPVDKGIQIAQQLCAGLAAAHARGVLHRDLKPANIMIDSQGQVRITDFGLATATSSDESLVGMSGTPAYMAPEQLLRGQTSIRSDIYALGLILHEVFTGQPVYSARSIADLRRFHEESSRPSTDASRPSDMNPIVERVMCQCLEPDPEDRPANVSTIAATLPGGDPLAAALAAGDTPRPELIAAYGGIGALPPRSVIGLVVTIVLLLAGAVYFSSRTHFVNLAPLEKPPAYLRERAKEIIHQLGYEETPIDSAGGFRAEPFDFRLALNPSNGASNDRPYTLFRNSPWSGAQYWYRQSPKPLVSRTYRPRGHIRTAVGEWSPSSDTTGMIRVRLDSRGFLRRLEANPPRDRRRKIQQDSSIDWDAWFPKSMVNFEFSQLEPSSGEWARDPKSPFDTLATWEGTWPDSTEPLHVVAAAYRGKTVYFDVVPPGAVEPSLLSSRYRGTRWFRLIVFGVVFSVTIAVAVFHLLSGRGDRIGAIRLSIGIAILEFAAWLTGASHIFGVEEIEQFRTAVGAALVAGAFTGLLYLAVEPLVRRDWPELLVSLTRLIRGRYRDPRIGRDLLIGTVVGAVGHYLSWVIPSFLDGSVIVVGSFQALSSSAAVISQLVGKPGLEMIDGLGIMFTLWVLLRATRRKWAALLGTTGLGCLVIYTQAGLEPWYLPFLAVHLLMTLAVVARFGILTGCWANFVWFALQMPLTTNTGSFFFERGVISVGVIITTAVYGAYTSTSRNSSSAPRLTLRSRGF